MNFEWPPCKGITSAEMGFQSNVTSSILLSKEEIIEANISYRKKFRLGETGYGKTLPSIYWLPPDCLHL